MKENRGGPRKGAGLKKGTPYKNALKMPSERRTVKKQVTYTKEEFKRKAQAMLQNKKFDGGDMFFSLAFKSGAELNKIASLCGVA